MPVEGIGVLAGQAVELEFSASGAVGAMLDLRPTTITQDVPDTGFSFWQQGGNGAIGGMYLYEFDGVDTLTATTSFVDPDSDASRWYALEAAGDHIYGLRFDSDDQGHFMARFNPDGSGYERVADIAHALTDVSGDPYFDFREMAFDGTYFWVMALDLNSDSVGYPTHWLKIDPTDWSWTLVAATWPGPDDQFNFYLMTIEWDGTQVVANDSAGSTTNWAELNPATGVMTEVAELTPVKGERIMYVPGGAPWYSVHGVRVGFDPGDYQMMVYGSDYSVTEVVDIDIEGHPTNNINFFRAGTTLVALPLP